MNCVYSAHQNVASGCSGLGLDIQRPDQEDDLQVRHYRLNNIDNLTVTYKEYKETLIDVIES